MKATVSAIEGYLKDLKEAPRRIRAATLDVDEKHLQFKPDDKSWSANDILAHIRSCADLWTHSIYSMLAEDGPEFSDISERKWAKVTRYAELSFAESFQVYYLQRANLLRVLQSLPFEAWERSAVIFGRKHTIFTQTRRMAKHEQEHCMQIEGLLK